MCAARTRWARFSHKHMLAAVQPRLSQGWEGCDCSGWIHGSLPAELLTGNTPLDHGAVAPRAGQRPRSWYSLQDTPVPCWSLCPITRPGDRHSTSSSRLQRYSTQKILEASQPNLQDLCKTSCGHRWFLAAATFPPPSFHGLQIPLVNRSLKMQITAGHASTAAGDTRVCCSPTKSVSS